MSLIDKLRDIGAALPPSHIPGLAEALPILGALVAAAEHDVEKLLDAVEADVQAAQRGEPATAVNDVLAPPGEEASDAPVAAQAPASAPVGSESPAQVPAPVQVPSDQAELVQAREQNAELEAEVASLRQQLQTAQADAQRTTATVEPVDAPADAPTPDAAAAADVPPAAPAEPTPAPAYPEPEGPVS